MGHSTVPHRVGIGSKSSTSSHMGPTLRMIRKLDVVPMPLPPKALLSQVLRETGSAPA